MIIGVKIDPVGYAEKPKGREIGAVQNRLKNTPYTEQPLENVLDALTAGHTITAANCTNNNKTNFVCADLIVLDFDNGHSKEYDKAKTDSERAEIVKAAIDQGHTITVEELNAKCDIFGMPRPIVYRSFSWGTYYENVLTLEKAGLLTPEQCERIRAGGTMRAIWVLSERYTDITKYDDLYSRMCAIFPQCDESFKHCGLIFGTQCKDITKPATIYPLIYDAVPDLRTPADKSQMVISHESEKAAAKTATAPKSRRTRTTQSRAEQQRENIRLYLTFLEPSKLSDAEWINVANAMKTEGFSYAEFDDWCRSDGDKRYNERENLTRWNSLEIGKVTGATVCDYAKEYGRMTEDDIKAYWRNKNNAAADFSGIAGLQQSTPSQENTFQKFVGATLTPTVFSEIVDMLGINFRWNILRHRIEYSGFNTDELPDTLSNAAPGILQEIFTALTLKRNTLENISMCLLLHATRRAFDPVLEIIDRIQWDGKDRLQQIYDLWGLSENLDKVLLKKWLIQSYCLLHNQLDGAFGAEFCLVLQGPQGCGKTSFFKHLAMRDEFFAEGATFDPSDKDSLLESLSAWLCELGEVGSTMKSDLDKLKAALLRSVDRIRPPYARAADEYPRRTSLCATVNDEKFLVDLTGNRRWGIIAIPEGKRVTHTDLEKLDAAQLWAQIAHEVNEQIRMTANTARPMTYARAFRLTDNEMKAVVERADGYLKPVKAQDEVSDIISMLETKTPPSGYKLIYKHQNPTDFKQTAELVSSELRRFSSVQIGKALQVLGYAKTQKKKNGVPFYGYTLPAWELSAYNHDV